MPSSLFSPSGSLFRSSRRFEVRLDQPYVVFEGTPAEGAQPVTLTGSVHLNYRKPMDIKRIRVKLVGTLKLYWEFGWEPGEITKRKDTIYEKELVLLPVGDVDGSSLHTINGGPQDYSFRFELPPETHDTVNGLARDGWRHHIMVDWTLYATVERGFGSKDLSTARKIRVMRVEGSNPDIFDHEQVHESIWNDKLSYKISVPRVNHVFGTAIKTHFQLTPLKKGVAIRDIQLELRENTINMYDDSRRHPGQEVHQKDWYIVVQRKTFPMPEFSERRVAPDSTLLQDEAYVFDTTLDLPRNFRDCRQYVDTANVKIFHTLRIFVNILNPDGHVSQLKIRAVINLFLSPQLHINESTLSVSLPESQSTRETLIQPASQEAPPTYSLHHLDRVYDESDGSGNWSGQPRTGANSPVFYTQSRRASIENLRHDVRMAGMVARTRSHDASAGPSVPDTSNQVVSATALLSRLSNLPERAAQALPFAGRPRDGQSSSQRRPSDETVNVAAQRVADANRPSTRLHPHDTPPGGSRHHSRRSSLQVSFQEPSSRPSYSDHSSHGSAIPSSRTSYIAEHPERAPTLANPDSSADADDDAAPDDSRLPYDIEALCKTPSYNTALRTPAPGSPADERRGLPTYFAAVSRPSTPPGPRTSGEEESTRPQGGRAVQRAAPSMLRSESASSQNSRGSAKSAGSEGDPDAGRGLLHRLRGRCAGESSDRRRSPPASPPAGENEPRRNDTDDDLYG